MKKRDIFAFLFTFLCPIAANARPEYAAKEEKFCAFCHIDPAGGGPRNPVGQFYEKNNHEFPAGFDAKKVLEEAKKSEVSVNPFLDLRAIYIKAFDIHAEKIENVATPRCDSCHSSKDTFFLMQGEVGISARIADKLNLRLSNNMGTPQDMFMMIEALPEKLHFKAGQFEMPFGIKQKDHNILVRQGFGIGSNRRDVGMEIGGTYSLEIASLSYSAAVFNGGLDLGIVAAQNTDKNQSKAAVVNADLRYKFLRVGGSLLVDRKDEIIGRKSVDVTQTRAAAFANTTYKIFSVEGEFDVGKDAEPKNVNSIGYFASLIFNPHPKFRTIARYETFDPDTDMTGDSSQRVSLIAEYNFIQNGSIQLMYWLNIASKDKLPPDLDANARRQLEGKDQLVLVSHFWF